MVKVVRKKSSSGVSQYMDISKRIKKSEIQEEKENKKYLEALIKSILEKKLSKVSEENDQKLNQAISKNFTEIKHDLYSTESVLSTRINSLENKLSLLITRIDNLENTINSKNEVIVNDMNNLRNEFNLQLETEKNKRSISIKKIQEKMEQLQNNIYTVINTNKQDSMVLVTNLSDDIRIQAKELVSFKDSFDDFKKQKNNNSTFETNMVIDHLSNRIQKLELTLADEDVGPIPGGSPNRFSTTKVPMSRVRKIEDLIFELQNQIKENDLDIQHVKSTLVSRNNRNQLYTVSDGLTNNNNDVKDIEKRIKKLAESTTKACKSLSQGLTEVQQATLNLYSWTDKVHEAFDQISDKVDLPSNICPRAKVSNSKLR